MTAKKKQPSVDVDSVFIAHRYQLELFTEWRRFNIAITCRGWGKTVAAVMKLHDEAMNAKVPLTYAYVAPAKAQAWDVISPVIQEFMGHLEEVDVGAGKKQAVIRIKESAMEVHYPNGAKIKAYGADHPNNRLMRGKTFGGVVVDEFDSTSLETWRKIIRPCLRKYNGWALLIGTIEPGSNLCHMRDEMSGHADWQCKTYKLSECWPDLPAYTEDDYNGLLIEYASSPNIFAREYECDETASDDDVVIPTGLIYAAKGRHVPRECYESMPKILGVDVATGGGADKSTICKRQGMAIEGITEYNLDNMAFADQVASVMNAWSPDAVFIDKGRGEGVISRLRQLGYSAVIGVDFGGGATRGDIYANKRIEMYHGGIKDWLENGGCLPDSKDLCQELAAPCLKPSDGKLVMEKKHDIKKKLGRSPDNADALALTFALPVRRASDSKNHSRVKTVASTGYNPLQRRRRSHGLFR